MRYVHPQANAVHKLFGQLSELDRKKTPELEQKGAWSVQNRVQPKRSLSSAFR